MFEALKDAVQLALIAAALYFAFRVYVRRKRTAWIEPLESRRFAVWGLIILAILAVKIAEDALGGESGPFDRSVLWFIHAHLPASLAKVFAAITLTGSSKCLFPLAALATAALVVARRRAEAALLAASMLGGAFTVYVVKAATGRARPALWATDWYWGTSFPSGHTLAVAAFATAAALCAKRIRPAAGPAAFALAAIWIAAVGFSRLALGVHWPTDVLAAACIGIFLPLAISLALDLRSANRLPPR